MKKELKRLSISDETYQKILGATQFKQKVENIQKYSRGYQDKYIIRFTDDALICRYNFLVYAGIIDESEEMEDKYWYQVLCVRCDSQGELTAPTSSPATSCKRIKKILNKHYTDDEIVEIYHQHENEKSSIIHVPIQTEKGKILRFDNCYYYDANGAYASQLINMFPKCTEDFQYKFEHRHDNNNAGKNDFNYFVGCLTQNEKKRQQMIDAGKEPRITYPKTRHYIVNKVTDMLYHLEKKLDAEQIIYANTDGIVVQNPRHILSSEKDVGTFKIEYQGTVYTYRGDNYTIMQMGDDIQVIDDDLKGNLPISLRKLINLKEGKVIEYDRVLIDGYYQYINVKEKYI